MLKTHSWRTASLVMALTLLVGLALPALGDDWLPSRGYADETLTGAAPVDDDCLKLYQVTTVGAGQATYLGRFTRLACGVPQPDGSVKGTIEYTAGNTQACLQGGGDPGDARMPGPWRDISACWCSVSRSESVWY
jgi:hypothetical protein